MGPWWWELLKLIFGFGGSALLAQKFDLGVLLFLLVVLGIYVVLSLIVAAFRRMGGGSGGFLDEIPNPFD